MTKHVYRSYYEWRRIRNEHNYRIVYICLPGSHRSGVNADYCLGNVTVVRLRPASKKGSGKARTQAHVINTAGTCQLVIKVARPGLRIACRRASCS